MSAAGSWGYRPALDGLRTVAVYVVIAFHADIGLFAGGFVGVDLFFVLSGFLVTSVLLAEHARSGRIDLFRFYARRVRRLLPAAVVAIVAVAAIALFVEPPLTRASRLGDARSALLYFSNWQFLGNATDYFAADVATSPYLHFWSLSIEEQFYAAFPLLLVGILAFARWRRMWVVLPAVLGVLTAASVAMQLFWERRNPLHAYYGTDTRVYQLLAGACLAAFVARRTRAEPAGARRPVLVAASAVTLLALLAVSTQPFDVAASTRGLVAAAVSVALIASLEWGGTSPVATLLSRPTVVYLGRISYSTYLWHWPIIVFLRPLIDLPPTAVLLAAAVGATAMASLSYTLLEMPIRTARLGAGRPHAVVAGGLAASIVAATIAAPTILNNGRHPVVHAANGVATASREEPPPGSAAADQTDATTDATVPDDLDLAAAASYTTGMFSCADAEPTDCILNHGEGLHVFLLGDSNAAIFVPMFRALAEDHGFTFSATTAAGCPWQLGLGWRVDDRNLLDACIATRADVYERVLPALAPDIVVTVHVSRDDPARPSPPYIALDESLGTGDQLVATVTANSLDRLEQLGVRVLLIEPVPYGSFDAVQCLSGVVRVADCAYEASVEPSPTEVVYRYEALERSAVYVADFDPLVCPLKPVCLPILDGELVLRDALHVYPPYTIDHRARFWAVIEATGVLD